MLSFARDLPNVCSLAGLFAAVLGLCFAIRGVDPAAMMALLWTIVFDWNDGLIARRMKGRTDGQRAFGARLDSLIDLVGFSAAPLLLSVGRFSPWFVPGAFVIVAAGVIRLSYFNVFRLLDASTYRGLALDTHAAYPENGRRGEHRARLTGLTTVLQGYVLQALNRVDPGLRAQQPSGGRTSVHPSHLTAGSSQFDNLDCIRRIPPRLAILFVRTCALT